MSVRDQGNIFLRDPEPEEIVSSPSISSLEDREEIFFDASQELGQESAQEVPDVVSSFYEPSIAEIEHPRPNQVYALPAYDQYSIARTDLTLLSNELNSDHPDYWLKADRDNVIAGNPIVPEEGVGPSSGLQSLILESVSELEAGEDGRVELERNGRTIGDLRVIGVEPSGEFVVSMRTLTEADYFPNVIGNYATSHVIAAVDPRDPSAPAEILQTNREYGGYHPDPNDAYLPQDQARQMVELINAAGVENYRHHHQGLSELTPNARQTRLLEGVLPESSNEQVMQERSLMTPDEFFEKWGADLTQTGTLLTSNASLGDTYRTHFDIKGLGEEVLHSEFTVPTITGESLSTEAFTPFVDGEESLLDIRYWPDSGESGTLLVSFSNTSNRESISARPEFRLEDGNGRLFIDGRMVSDEATVQQFLGYFDEVLTELQQENGGSLTPAETYSPREDLYRRRIFPRGS